MVSTYLFLLKSWASMMPMQNFDYCCHHSIVHQSSCQSLDSHVAGCSKGMLGMLQSPSAVSAAAALHCLGAVLPCCLQFDLMLLALQSTFWIDHVPAGNTIDRDTANHITSGLKASGCTLSDTDMLSPLPGPQSQPHKTLSNLFITSQIMMVQSLPNESCLNSAASGSCHSSDAASLEHRCWQQIACISCFSAACKLWF